MLRHLRLFVFVTAALTVSTVVALAEDQVPEPTCSSKKIVVSDPNVKLCASWSGITKCVTAQQIMFIGAKERTQ